tara:strand:+ start:15 stop:155 length:141 start_codon:yes stop_codon:yes gene_type:complete
MILLHSSPSKVGTVSVIAYVDQVTLSWTMPFDGASKNYPLCNSRLN